MILRAPRFPIGALACCLLPTILLLPAGAAPAVAQAPRAEGASEAMPGPTVVADRMVSEADYPHPLIEPHLSILPGDPDHRLVVASAIEAVDWRESFASSCVAYATRDGGLGWVRTDFDLLDCGDPWSAIDAEGTAWFMGLGSVGGQNGLVTYRSSDGGFSWEDPVVIPGAFDHGFFVLDEAGDDLHAVAAQSRRGTEGEVMHGIWTGRAAGGALEESGFDVPVRGSQEPTDGEQLSDGSLVVIWVEHSAAGTGRKLDTEIRASVSTDGGATFGPSAVAAELCSEGRPSSWPQLTRVPVAGEDGGDRLLLSCENDDFSEILVHRSDDGGRVWGPAERIDRSEDRRHPWLKTPALAARADGAVAAVWYDGRAGSFHQCHLLVGVSSPDGGESWSEETVISTEPSCPYTDANGDAAWRFPGGGDYIGMAAAGGRWVVVFPEARDDLYRLRMVELE